MLGAGGSQCSSLRTVPAFALVVLVCCHLVQYGRYAYLPLAVPSSCLPPTLAVHLRTPAAPVLQPEQQCMYPRRQTKAGRYLSRQVAHVLTQGG